MDGIADAQADLTACDRERITRLEQIQGFGFLVALSEDWKVARASANLVVMLGVEASDAIGTPLDALIAPQAVHDIRNRVLVLRAHRGSERLYGIELRGTRTVFDLALHYSDNLLIVEGEPSGLNAGPDAAALVRTMMARLGTMKTLQNFHGDAARQIRAITGFSRVMIYRFAEDGTGDVVAESINGPMESFLGLRYPASDIPAQARALYLRNPFRVIGDVGAAVVDLLPVASATVPVLDLSLAVTRAVSPVHIEYLRNMGVAASLSVSIIVEGRLWGLIACHSDIPGVPAFSRRSASELFTQMYSMMLEGRIRQDDAARETTARQEVDRLIGSIAGDRRLLDDAPWLHDKVRSMIECDGMAVFAEGTVSTSGAVPPHHVLTALAQTLTVLDREDVFFTDGLVARFPALFYKGSAVAGLMAIPASRAAGHLVLLFRQEWIERIVWAGNQQALPKEPDAVRISPRRSFEAFAEARHDHCRPFTVEERRTAAMIRSALVEIVAKIGTEPAVQAKRQTDRQELLIAELNHRVRNILALIRGLINQTVTSDNDVAGYVESLNGRVQALARAHDQVTRHNWGPGLLSTLFEHEIRACVSAQIDRFRIVGPAVWLLPEAFSTMALVIHELVTNSLKYGALAGTGRVEVVVGRVLGQGLGLTWREIGGPPVVIPTRRGFGSAIIERTIPFDLQGTVDVRYEASGLEVDLFVPEPYLWLDDVPPTEGPAWEPMSPCDPAMVPLAGLTVLLLEDNLIVALETEDLLRDLGAATVHAAATVAAAFVMLDRGGIDCAVLDVNLGSGTSLDFARICEDRDIPFIFASGYGRDLDTGVRHRSVPVVNKPYDARDVASAIVLALARSPRIVASDDPVGPRTLH